MSTFRCRWVAFALAMFGLAGPSTRVSAADLKALDSLLADYRALGLPVPSADAELVRYSSGGVYIVNGEVQPVVYRLGFLVKPPGMDTTPELLVGAYSFPVYQHLKTEPAKPVPASIPEDGIDPDDALTMAAQCHARGWDALAGRLLELGTPADAPPVGDRLTRAAWYYWLGRVTHPVDDRRPVADRLKALVRRDKTLDTEVNRRLIRDLDIALVPGQGKPGTTEALVDDLVNFSTDTSTMFQGPPDERYVKIVRLGFDAVPVLIAHLDDDRLTRAQMEGFNNFWPWHLRVRHVASDLLEGLAGHSLRGGWLDRQKGYAVEKEKAEAWWADARKTGEEAYLMGHVTAAERNNDGPPWISYHLLTVIEAKYPDRVGPLYVATLRDRPQVDTGLLVEAVVRSGMPASDKVRLLEAGSTHADPRHRRPALAALAMVDQKRFTELWMDAVRDLPDDVSEKYWACPEAYIAGLAIESDDPRVWPILKRVIGRSKLGLRMELLNQFGDPADDRHRQERLRLLTGFLNDAGEKVVSSDKRYDGPGAGFPYASIQVRNFVALEIAALVGREVPFDPDRRAEDWDQIRREMKAAADKELAADE